MSWDDKLREIHIRNILSHYAVESEGYETLVASLVNESNRAIKQYNDARGTSRYWICWFSFILGGVFFKPGTHWYTLLAFVVWLILVVLDSR